jgi:phosphatidylserine/phosphatidylglycerophosphate/cardiolipin synthase-like enzyme
MNDLQKLHSKLSRELAQSEQSARVHPVREARRLGDVPPAAALLAISEHARAIRPRLEAIQQRESRIGIGAGRAVGQTMSALRYLVFDRFLDVERSFRATLLGVRHGLHVALLLREVASQENDVFLVNFCTDLIDQRGRLVENAQRSMSWFAEEPTGALRSGLRVVRAAGR